MGKTGIKLVNEIEMPVSGKGQVKVEELDVANNCACHIQTGATAFLLGCRLAKLIAEVSSKRQNSLT